MSWSGTVQCGNCYEKGHNKTSCPILKKAWEEDPNSYYGKQWQRILDRKAKPKICSYCDKSGHTRASCDIVKSHKTQFQAELLLWRTALVKWMKETGLGIGSLVRCNDASYYDNDVRWMYATDEDYVAPVGMVLNQFNEGLIHYSGITNSSHWMSSVSLVNFERIGSSEHPYHRTIQASLPSIAGIVPSLGKVWGDIVSRSDRCRNTGLEVVSKAVADFNFDNFLSIGALKKATKEHFAASYGETNHTFRAFGSMQRRQLQQYVNGEIELSQMVDPELSENDT